MSKGSSSMRRGGRPGPVLPPDERLVMPETRYEVINGKVAYVPPADEPHGSRHSKVSALVEAHVVDGYDVAADMLTRASERDDVAPDVSVFPHARDKVTGGRQLEELAFEVLNTQKLGAAAAKARALSDRGVRRVFAIDVKKQRALVWSVRTGTWEMLPADGAIADPVFIKPLPIDALVGAARSDDAVAEALLAKGNRVLARATARAHAEGEARGRAEGEARGRAEGEARGRAEGEAHGRAVATANALLVLLDARGFKVSARMRARVLAARESATVNEWLRRAATCAKVEDVFEAKASRPGVRRPKSKNR